MKFQFDERPYMGIESIDHGGREVVRNGFSVEMTVFGDKTLLTMHFVTTDEQRGDMTTSQPTKKRVETYVTISSEMASLLGSWLIQRVNGSGSNAHSKIYFEGAQRVPVNLPIVLEI